MATTAAGTPYVEASDLVANYPGVSLALANHIDATAGKVLQVVTTIKTSRFTTSSASYVDITGYTATITPSATSSKILVMSSFHISGDQYNSSPALILLRGATSIGIGDASGSSERVTAGTVASPNTEFFENVSYSILDSPATAAAVTYKWQVKTYFSRQCTFNGSQITSAAQTKSTSSTIMLMEIGA